MSTDTACSRCNGSGVQSYRRHSPNEEDVEAIRCESCDGFGFHSNTKDMNKEFDRGFDSGFRICLHEVRHYIFSKLNHHNFIIVDGVSFTAALTEHCQNFLISLGAEHPQQAEKEGV